MNTHSVRSATSLTYNLRISSLEGVEQDLERMKAEKYWKRFLKKESIQTKLLERRNVIRASYDAMMVRNKTRKIDWILNHTATTR